MRCRQCGENNPDAETTCRICNAALRPVRQVILAPSRPAGQNNAAGSAVPTSQNIPVPVRPLPSPATHPYPVPARAASPAKARIPTTSVQAAPLPRQNQIQGRVIFVGHAEHQPEDFDLYSLLSRWLWLALLLLSPFLLLYALLVNIGILIGLFATTSCVAFGLWLFKKNPFAFLQTGFMLVQSGLMLALFRRGPAPTQPVRTLRIRDKTRQQEISVRIKGHFSSGDIILDDEVTIWGHWKNGNFVFARGINQRTGSHISLRFSRSKLLFWVTVLVTAGIGFAVYRSAAPLLHRLGH